MWSIDAHNMGYVMTYTAMTINYHFLIQFYQMLFFIQVQAIITNGLKLERNIKWLLKL